MDRARQITGLSDFGDASLREGLEQTTTGFRKVPLNARGRAEADAMIVEDLARRLRLEEWHRTHPDIAKSPINGPVLVCGLPRTGTTAMVAMLALDPRFRFVRRWEADDPVPPPRTEAEQDDPRRMALIRSAENYPLKALHLSDPDGPEEDLLLLAGLSMRSYHGSFPMPDDYIAWWINDDFRAAYAYHARTLRLLQSRRPPNHWLLKSPPHLFKLEAFAEQFPDATFIWTHRDPAKVVPSVASLHHAVFALRGVEPMVTRAWTGERCLRFWEEGMKRGLAARARIGEHRFVDVYNSEIIRDPIGSFEALYDKLGWNFTDELRSALGGFHARNAQGKHGRHDYALDEYGLDRAQVRAAFRQYTDRFNV